MNPFIILILAATGAGAWYLLRPKPGSVTTPKVPILQKIGRGSVATRRLRPYFRGDAGIPPTDLAGLRNLDGRAARLSAPAILARAAVQDHMADLFRTAEDIARAAASGDPQAVLDIINAQAERLRGMGR
jgi:hypothetical protein